MSEYHKLDELHEVCHQLGLEIVEVLGSNSNHPRIVLNFKDYMYGLEFYDQLTDGDFFRKNFICLGNKVRSEH